MKSFRQKLMVFVCLICGVLIGIVLLFAQFLLEPAYLAMMKSNLNREIDAIADSMEQYGLLNEEGTDYQPQMEAEVGAMVIEGQCLDISTLSTMTYLGGAEHIAGCSLHTDRVEDGLSNWIEHRSNNNLLLVKLRLAVAEDGKLMADGTVDMFCTGDAAHE